MDHMNVQVIELASTLALRTILSYTESIAIAETIIGEGYIKQRNGEWKGAPTNTGQWGYYCTICGAAFVGENAEWIAKEHNYCPKCGAKMKGGAE